jgi:hypothetical protein
VAELLFADVSCDEDAATTLRLHKTLCLLGIFMLVVIHDSGVGAFFGVGYCNGSTDPAVASCNEGDLVQELSASAMRRALAFGARRHILFNSWLS